MASTTTYLAKIEEKFWRMQAVSGRLSQITMLCGSPTRILPTTRSPTCLMSVAYWISFPEKGARRALDEIVSKRPLFVQSTKVCMTKRFSRVVTFNAKCGIVVFLLDPVFLSFTGGAVAPIWWFQWNLLLCLAVPDPEAQLRLPVLAVVP